MQFDGAERHLRRFGACLMVGKWPDHVLSWKRCTATLNVLATTDLFQKWYFAVHLSLVASRDQT